MTVTINSDLGHEQRAGPWILEPRGLAACGNKVDDSIVGTEGFQLFAKTVATESPRFNTDYATHMSANVEKGRVITDVEVEHFLNLGCHDEDLWEDIKVDSEISTRRYRDLTLFPGAVLTRLTSRIENTTAAHVIHCFCNFAYRDAWDKQVCNFKVLHTVASNDVLYYTLKCSPLYDRDFLVYHTIWRHESGKGLLIYSRSADDVLSPPSKSAVRATQYVQATEVMEDGRGGVDFCTTAAIDPCVPIPKWLATMLIPREFRRWVHSVDQRCKEMRASSLIPPSSALFARVPDATSPQGPVLQGVAVSDVNVDGVSACKGVVVGSGGSGSAERCPPSDSGMREAGDSSKPVAAQCETGQRNSPSLLVSSSDGKVYSTLGKAPSISTDDPPVKIDASAQKGSGYGFFCSCMPAPVCSNV